MRITMNKDGEVLKAEAVTKPHESGINCNRDAAGTPVDEAGRVAQKAFQKASAEIPLQTGKDDFNGEELITSAKLEGEE